MKSRRGFTLLEVMVASVIMAIAIVGLLSNISSATRNASRLRDYDHITQLAQLRMNELLVDSKVPLNVPLEGEFDRALSGGLRAGWQARLTNVEAPPPTHRGRHGAGSAGIAGLVDERPAAQIDCARRLPPPVSAA